MNRITNQMINNTMSYNLQRHQTEMDRIQNSLATGKNVNVPRDNPIAATNQMLYQTRLTEMDQYISNINESSSKLDEVDTALQSTLRIFQRLRVLTVQGANGIYTSFELKEAAATEINQLLEELVTIANTKGATGRSIFGGYQTGTEDQPNPFVPIYQTLTAGNQGDAMIGVEYRGNIGKLKREVAKGEYLDVSVPGNEVFWATNQILTSNKDASAYTRHDEPGDQDRREGDQHIGGRQHRYHMDKINNAGLSVRASKGGTNNLILETTTPHQIWLEDVGSGTVLKDLGLINASFPEPPNNIDPTVTIGGMSVFEMVIQLRDDLVRGDQAPDWRGGPRPHRHGPREHPEKHLAGGSANQPDRRARQAYGVRQGQRDHDAREYRGDRLRRNDHEFQVARERPPVRPCGRGEVDNADPDGFPPLA